MCISEKEIGERLKNLPDVPVGLMTFLEPGDFHGIVTWRVVKGSMMSFHLLEHENCDIFHTKLERGTEVSWHTHGKNSKEIIICLDGEITLMFKDGTTLTLNEKDKCEIGVQVEHMAVIGSKPCQIVAMTIPKEQ